MRWLAVAIVGWGLLAGPRAQATILFASSEDTGFTAVGGAMTVSASPTPHRSGYSRVVLAPTANSGASDPPTNRLLPSSGAFAASNPLWVHAQIWEGAGTFTANQQGIILRSPDGVSRIIVRQTGTYGLFKVSTRNAAGTITDLAAAAANPMIVSTVTQLDLRVDYSATGGVQLWLGGVQVINYTGDPRTDAATQLNQVEFGHLAGTTSWSEIIIADQDTRAMGLVTLPPGNSGNTQGWTPNTFTNISETILNDATFVSDSTGNVLSQWQQPTTLPGGTPQILAIIQEARVRKGGTGPTAFDWSVRTGGADYLAGTTTALTTSFVNYANQIWATNPATGTGWQASDINAGGSLNLGIKSLP